MSAKAIASVFVAGLLSFYVWVFYLAMNPSVSEVYRLYFIERKIRHWAAGRGLEYNLGEVVDFNKFQPYLSRRGWQLDPEEWGIWSQGASSELYFRIPAGTRLRLISIKGRPFLAPNQGIKSQRVEIFVDSVQVASHTLTEDRMFDIKIPVDTVAAPMLRIRLEYSNPKAPVELGLSLDDRILAFGLVQLSIQ